MLWIHLHLVHGLQLFLQIPIEKQIIENILLDLTREKMCGNCCAIDDTW